MATFRFFPDTILIDKRCNKEIGKFDNKGLFKTDDPLIIARMRGNYEEIKERKGKEDGKS